MHTVEKKEMLSVSRIRMFLRCPLAFQYKYIDGIATPSNANLLLGKAIHKGLEVNYKQKIATRTDVPISYLLDVYSTTFDEMRQQEDVDFGEDDPGKIKDDGVGYITLYHTEVAPKIQPVAVEEHFVLEFNNTGYALQGYIDLLDEHDIIRDHKFVKRSFAPDAVENDMQLTAYGIAFKYLKGRNPAGFALDAIIKNKTPKIQSITCGPRNEQQMQRFLKLLGFVSTSIAEGIYYPCENPINCSWCNFKGHCKNW